MLSCCTCELLSSPFLPWRKEYLLWKLLTSLKLYQSLMRPQVSHFNFLFWLHHQPTLPSHQLMQFPRLFPVTPAVQHQPSLPMPAQTQQLQAGEHPNLPEQPQHPLENPHLSTYPMNFLPHLLPDMSLEP
uniref:Amelogenin n=1 Tax=Strigops habroptila TaxID=2489341 RepID=A0A672V524_STRHB